MGFKAWLTKRLLMGSTMNSNVYVKRIETDKEGKVTRFISDIEMEVILKNGENFSLRAIDSPSKVINIENGTAFVVSKGAVEGKKYEWVCYTCGKVEKDYIPLGGWIICDECSEKEEQKNVQS